MFNKEAVKLLGLSKKEDKILVFLAGISHSTVTDIAMEIKIDETFFRVILVV